MATESQQITQMIASRYGTANYGNLQVLKWQYYDYVRMTPSTGIVSQKLNFFSIPQGSLDPNSPGRLDGLGDKVQFRLLDTSRRMRPEMIARCPEKRPDPWLEVGWIGGEHPLVVDVLTGLSPSVVSGVGKVGRQVPRGILGAGNRPQAAQGVADDLATRGWHEPQE